MFAQIAVHFVFFMSRLQFRFQHRLRLSVAQQSYSINMQCRFYNFVTVSTSALRSS